MTSLLTIVFAIPMCVCYRRTIHTAWWHWKRFLRSTRQIQLQQQPSPRHTRTMHLHTAVLTTTQRWTWMYGKIHFGIKHNSHCHNYHHWHSYLHLEKVQIQLFIGAITISSISSCKMPMQNTLKGHFDEVANSQTSKTQFGPIFSVAVYLTRLRLLGFLDISNIQIIPTCGCSENHR